MRVDLGLDNLVGSRQRFKRETEQNDGCQWIIPFPINTSDPCSICKKEVLRTKQAYDNLISSVNSITCHSIMFTCSHRRRKGTLGLTEIMLGSSN